MGLFLHAWQVVLFTSRGPRVWILTCSSLHSDSVALLDVVTLDKFNVIMEAIYWAEKELEKCMYEMDNKQIRDFVLEKRADWIAWKKNPHRWQAVWGECGKGRLDMLEPYLHP